MRVRELRKRVVVGKEWTPILRTTSSSSNWCFNRFRLYNANSGVEVQARRPDGTILSTQLFRDTNYTWGANFEASFLFDFSYNTAGEEIEIYITGIRGNMTFQQMYGYTGHAGTAVRWPEDPNIVESISNTFVTYINMGFLKFTGGYPNEAVAFVYMENNGVYEIDGADQYYGVTLDLRNNNLPAATADQTIIGCDNQGRSNGRLYLAGNNGRTAASDAAWTNLQNKGWLLSI